MKEKYRPDRQQVGQICKFSEFVPDGLPCSKVVHKGFKFCSFHTAEYLISEKMMMERECFVFRLPLLHKLYLRFTQILTLTWRILWPKRK